mmetsp:Transcript_2195/g.4696  ORF Transcript_2195/g.4696 Transcript_2195/m.4696 type:complete len:106 (+) Transcript_2195:1611-1928(+)
MSEADLRILKTKHSSTTLRLLTAKNIVRDRSSEIKTSINCKPKKPIKEIYRQDVFFIHIYTVQPYAAEHRLQLQGMNGLEGESIDRSIDQSIPASTQLLVPFPTN